MKIVKIVSSDAQNLSQIVTGMTPQEKDKYFRHLSMRAKQEVEREESLKQDRLARKKKLIEDILKSRPGVWTREFLNNKSIGYLERLI